MFQVNDKIKVRWMWCGGFYQAEAVIVKINRKSIRCKLLEDVDTTCGEDGWKAGDFIRVPKQSEVEWSQNNGVFVS